MGVFWRPRVPKRSHFESILVTFGGSRRHRVTMRIHRQLLCIIDIGPPSSSPKIDYFRVCFWKVFRGAFRLHFGATFGESVHIWGSIGVPLGPFGPPRGGKLADMLPDRVRKGSRVPPGVAFWSHFGSILVPIWSRFGNYSGRFPELVFKRSSPWVRAKRSGARPF